MQLRLIREGRGREPEDNHGGALSFGHWVVRPHRRELLHDGKPVDIGSRAFDILMALIGTPGSLVTKDELLDRVWPGTIVEENNLQVQISALRKAMGADRNLILTLPGRGYRFVGEVRRHGADADPGAAPEEASPGRAKKPTPANNLPVAVTELIGREGELDELIGLVGEHRLVTLTGAGGIGKTRLGLNAAQLLLPDFPDGIWLAELAALGDPLLVPGAVNAALGLPADAERMPANILAATLRPKRLLLVIDNCEHVVGAAAEITERLLHAAPELRVLATSREPLRIDGECVYRVPPLGVPPEATSGDEALRHGAVRLFLARARAADPHFMLDQGVTAAVAAICRRLDGIPLAIELAASRAAALGVESLNAHLEDLFRLLTGGRRTALARHQTLRATLDWSHGLLDAREQTVFRRLAVFAGGFTLDAASAVAADGELGGADVVDCIGSLIAKSLVISETGATAARCRLLETTRVYAMEKLAVSGETGDAARRHAEYYRDLLGRAETLWEAAAETDWLATYPPELDNVRAALDWAFSPGGSATTGVALTAAAAPLWIQLSLLNECRERVSRALAGGGAGTTLDPERETALQAGLGLALLYTKGALGDTELAWARTLELAEQTGNVEYQSRALYGLWLGNLRAGNYRSALAIAERFQRVVETNKDKEGIIVADRLLAPPLHYLGDHEAARQRFQRMLDRSAPPFRRPLPVRFATDQRVGAHIHLARILWLQGAPDQARRSIAAGLEQAKLAEHGNSLCLALADGASIHAALLRDLSEAEAFAAQLANAVEKHGLAIWHAYSLGLHGFIQAKRGAAESAIPLLRAGLEGIRETLFDTRYVMLLCGLAETLGAAGRLAEALDAIEEALQRSERNEERWCLPELLRIRGELQLQKSGSSGAAAASADDFHRALDWARRQRALSWELRAATSLARVWREQGRTAESRDLLVPIYERFVEGFGTADLCDANLLLKELR